MSGTRTFLPLVPKFNVAAEIQNVTTGASSLFAPLALGAETWGIRISVTANTWIRLATPGSGGAAVASPSVNTGTGLFATGTQAWVAGQALAMVAGAQGTVPAGFTAGTVYYVIATGLTTTAAELSATPGGSAIVPTTNAPCSLQPLATVTATNSILVKASDPPELIGVTPGSYVGTLEVSATATVNIAELTR